MKPKIWIPNLFTTPSTPHLTKPNLFLLSNPKLPLTTRLNSPKPPVGLKSLLANLPRPPPSPHPPSPPPVEIDPTPLPPPEYHRGPKVDPRWPIEQQLFLGPIPVVVTWDEIRVAFYNKINRVHVVHTYVQSKPVNEVVYGMIVFDKSSTANKILKEGPITVKGYLISVSPMCQRLHQRKK